MRAATWWGSVAGLGILTRVMAAQEPPLATLVQPLAIPWEVCKQRARAALVTEGYEGLLESGNGTGMIFVRTRGDPLTLVETVRREVHATDPNIPLFNVMTMEQRAGVALARPRFATTLLGVFAGIALCLAAIGLYGVMAFSVAQRTREIGLRMALGAEQARVLRGVLWEGLLLAGCGIVLGLVSAMALQRVLAGMLYGVEGSDPPTLAAVALLMVLAAAVAVLVPARRATRIDPMEALRSE